MQASNRFLIDGELVLRAAGLSPVTSDVNTDELPLDRLTAYWASAGDHADQHQFTVVLDVESIAADDGQTYEFAAEIGGDVVSTLTVSEAGKAYFNIARETVEENSDAALRLALTTTLGPISSATVTFNAAAFVGLEITVDDGDANEAFTFEDGLNGTLDPGADEEDSAQALADAINNSSTIDCTATVDGAVVTITTNFLDAGDPMGSAAVTSANDDDPATATVSTFTQGTNSIAFNAYASPFVGK